MSRKFIERPEQLLELKLLRSQYQPSQVHFTINSVKSSLFTVFPWFGDETFCYKFVTFHENINSLFYLCNDQDSYEIHLSNDDSMTPFISSNVRRVQIFEFAKTY